MKSGAGVSRTAIRLAIFRRRRDAGRERGVVHRASVLECRTEGVVCTVGFPRGRRLRKGSSEYGETSRSTDGILRRRGPSGFTFANYSENARHCLERSHGDRERRRVWSCPYVPSKVRPDKLAQFPDKKRGYNGPKDRSRGSDQSTHCADNSFPRVAENGGEDSP